jgi:hypothetical protein
MPQRIRWWNFENFQKSKNAGNCPKTAQNQKIFKNFNFKISFKMYA